MNKDLKTTAEEGMVAKTIESVTAQVPSDIYLWTAIGAMSASLCLKLMKKSHAALFVGQWVSPFLLMGIYNKIVKTEGHDQKDK
jgi:hypothetical protein